MKRIQPNMILVTHTGNVYRTSHPGERSGWWYGHCIEVGASEPHHKPGGIYLVKDTSCAHVLSPNGYEVFRLTQTQGALQ